MRLSKERVGILAQNIVKGLIGRHYITADLPEGELSLRITHVIMEELMVEDRLEDDVRKILKTYEKEIQQGDADFHKMFLMIKKKLAKERGIVL